MPKLGPSGLSRELTVSCGVDHIATFVRFELTSSIEADGKRSAETNSLFVADRDIQWR